MRLSPNNVVACIGFAVLSAVGVFLSFKPKLVDPIRVLSSAAATTATLDNDYLESHGRAGTAFNVTYRFTVDGKEYRGSSATDEQPKPQMTVWYSRIDPAINGLELRGNAWFDLFIFTIPACVLLLSLGALVLHVRHRDDGRPAYIAGFDQGEPRRTPRRRG